MMEITSIIENAVALDINWKHHDFHYISDILSTRYSVHIDLEEEKIAILTLESTVIGYLYLDYPIFFVENELYSEIKSLLHEFDYLQYINIDNLSEKSLSVNPEIYSRYFYYFENLDNFSAEDFYFYNIQ